MTRVVATNGKGIRLGEDHQNAKLTNDEVDMMMRLRDEGWGWAKLAEKFEISKRHVRDIAAGKKRCQTASKWRVVRLPPPHATTISA